MAREKRKMHVKTWLISKGHAHIDDTDFGANKNRHEFGPFIWLPGTTSFHLMLNVLIQLKHHQQLKYTWYSSLLLCLIWLVILYSFLFASNTFMFDFLVFKHNHGKPMSNHFLIWSPFLYISKAYCFYWVLLVFPCMLTSSLLWTACGNVWGLGLEWVSSGLYLLYQAAEALPFYNHLNWFLAWSFLDSAKIIWFCATNPYRANSQFQVQNGIFFPICSKPRFEPVD